MPPLSGKFSQQLRHTLDTHFNIEKYKGGRGFDFSHQAMLLSVSLEAAVPLWCQELQQMRERMKKRSSAHGENDFWEEIEKRARLFADILAEQGDALLFRTKGKAATEHVGKRYSTAEVFNVLAEGIACLSFAVGGITLFGTHWEWERVVIDAKKVEE